MSNFADYFKFNKRIDSADSDRRTIGNCAQFRRICHVLLGQEDRNVFAPKTNNDPIGTTYGVYAVGWLR